MTQLQLADVDIYDPGAFVDEVPLDQLQLLRDEAPVHWHPHPDGGGFWVVSRYDDVRAVSRDHKTFSAQQGFVLMDEMPPDILAMTQGQLLGMDPPEHGPIRRAVISRFTTRRLAALEPLVRQIAREQLEKARALGDCNFVFDVAGNIPTAVICSMLGVPEDMWEQVRHWSDMQTSADDPDLGAGDMEKTHQASIDMGTYGYVLATERIDKGGDDLISLLVNVEVDGHKVTEAEFASLFVQITVAGNETTRSLMSTGMHELLKNPALYRRLEENPDQLPQAVEEMLRWSTPLHYFRRTATTDTELHGQNISAGDRVVMHYTAANYDERKFDNPRVFDIDRDATSQLAFGHGIHLCLGANLARMETRILFEEFFKMYSGIELLGEPRRIRSNLVNGFKHLPVRMSAR